jgi:hypothetical protein
MTIEDFLEKAMALGFKTFHIQATDDDGGQFSFLIQPSKAGGATKTFDVTTVSLHPVTEPSFIPAYDAAADN